MATRTDGPDVSKPASSSARASRGRALRAAAAILGAILFGNVLARGDLRAARDLVGSIGPSALVVLIPFAFAAVAHTFAWQRLFPTSRRPPFGALFAINLSMEALLLSAPGGAIVAETAGPYLLRARVGASIAESVASQAAKKIVIFFTNALYVATALALGGAVLARASTHLFGSSILVYVVSGAAVALLVVAVASWTAFVHGSIAERLHRLLLRVPWARARTFLAEREAHFTETDDRLAHALGRDRGGLALATVLCLFGWFAEAFESWLILRLLGADAAYTTVLGLEVAASLVRGAAFFLPAGVGVQDATYVALFDAVGISSASGLGVAFVLSKRAKELVWIALGYLFLAVLRRSPSVAKASVAAS